MPDLADLNPETIVQPTMLFYRFNIEAVGLKALENLFKGFLITSK